ncbi:MAG: hypothetical protein JWN86_4047 [Planctomycetota bacterium]|nr:hypothetical protein [Planctomycetota bacterium]
MKALTDRREQFVEMLVPSLQTDAIKEVFESNHGVLRNSGMKNRRSLSGSEQESFS